MSNASSIPPGADSSLLCVRGLSVSYAAGELRIEALRRIDFDVAPGEIVGILGESGSGKSTLALSLLGLLPANASVEGSILYSSVKNAAQEELLQLNEIRWRNIRGARISMIFQEPGLSLSPVMRVGDQVTEVLQAHQREGKPGKQKVLDMLQRVRLGDVERIFDAYPHQLSGGQLHRVAIAQALICGPELLISDESTRSLDVTVQAEILDLLRKINGEFGTAILFITHNPALLAGFADQVFVMYEGRIVERGRVSRVFRQPEHPYTKKLISLAARCADDPPGEAVAEGCFTYGH